MMVAAGLLVLVVISVALGVALRPRAERQLDFGLHPAMARLAMANFTFNLTSDAPQSPSEGIGLPTVPGPGQLGPGLVGFVTGGGGSSNKTLVKGDDYDELDKI